MTPCAFITGGSRNIGQGIAITLAKHGYDIAITYAEGKEGAESTKKQVEAHGRRCFIYEAHLQNPHEPEQVITQAHKDMGRLDVLVANAGRERRGSVLTFTAEDYDFLYANTIRNYLLCVGAAARLMVRDKTQGSIIMVTSVRANLAHPDDFLYGGFKAAMERACKSMALDLSEFGIRVNCLAPGAIWPPDRNRQDTPFVKESIPLSRVGTAADCGEAVAYLAGPQSSYVTGTTLLVDGGLALPGMLERYEATEWKTQKWSETRYNKAMEMLEGDRP
ncbi:MAG: SDR family oxidoreductase [Defluviitaleaceae bacterium]|nr:SDR family oxidoreductase [Defluviitaleaceae bacterium]